LLSPSYRRAAARLRAWKFPLDEVESLLTSQAGREARAESLDNVAEPTAAATALFTSHGARLAGLGPEDRERLRRVGYRFGYLIYVLDAFEDRARDQRSGDFNALLKFPGIDARAEILRTLATIEPEIPVEVAQRMRVNVEERLGMRLRVLHRGCRKPLRQRWQDAVKFARSMRERERAGFVKGAAVLATVSLAAFLFPHHVRGAESWRHCMGLGMNLMAAGSLFAFADVPDAPVGGDGAPTPKKAGFWSNCNCGCCCDSCDCGDCCECGSCCDC
jgi:hypothetical protein